MFKAIALITLLASISAHSCDTQYNFQVGPFFTTSMNIQFWKAFTDEVEHLTQCKVQLVSSPDYESYIQKIIQYEHDIYLAPIDYGPSLVKRGYYPVLHSKEGISGLIISRIDITNNKANFNGTRFITPSPYTRIYMEAVDWLDTHGLTNDVELTFSSSHDASILALLNNKAETTAVIKSIYEKLPENIKAGFHTHEIVNIGGGLIVAHDLPKDIRAAILSASGKIKLSKWVESHEIKSSRYSHRFETLFQNQESYNKN